MSVDPPEQDTRILPPGEDSSAPPTRLGGEDHCTPASLPRGTRIGEYRILRLIGTGGMGTVYLGQPQPRGELEDTDLVALKILHPHLLATPGHVARFRREAEIGQRILHPNVVRTMAQGEVMLGTLRVPYLVMEFVLGQTLRNLLRELGRVPEELCRHVGREVTRALVAIHDGGVIHRDLKPENVLITPEHTVKLMDLGVARYGVEFTRVSRAGEFIGSLRYAAPEQFQEEVELDGRVDCYALGVVLYELATGEHPHACGNVHELVGRIVTVDPCPPAQLNPQISPFLDELIMTLLARDRAGRLAPAQELLAVLETGEESTWWELRAAARRGSLEQAPLRRLPLPRETTLHGRQEEMRFLRQRFEEAREGNGVVVLLEGEAGVGKSRLVDELAQGLHEEGQALAFLHGACPPGETPGGALRTALLEHLGPEGLETTLRELLPDRPGLTCAFAAYLRGEPPPPDTPPLTAQTLPTAYALTLQALADRQPLILLIDDLHAAPEQELGLLGAVAVALAAHPVLLVGCCRPHRLDRWIESLRGRPRRLTLGRLEETQVQAILEEALGPSPTLQDLARRLVVKADGNPFFLFEILRGLREGEYLGQREDGTWVTTRLIEHIEIPATVRDLLVGRLSRLAPEDRELLEVAACCGHTFDPLLVGATLGVPSIPVLTQLGRVERQHRLVRSVGRRYRFDHHQIRELLVEELAIPLREEYHRSLARALEVRHGGAEREPGTLEEAVALTLCHHWFQGQEPARAYPYLEGALRHLEHTHDNRGAIALARRALDTEGLVTGPERVRLLEYVLWRCMRLGWREEERRAAEEADRLASELGDLSLCSRTRKQLGAHHLHVANYEKARELFEQALHLARCCGDRQAEAGAEGNISTLLATLGQFEEAITHNRRSLELARESGDRTTESISIGNLGALLQNLDRLEEALRCQQERFELAGQLGDRRGQAIATASQAVVLFLLARREEARVMAEQALVMAREVGERQVECFTTGVLSTVLGELGRPAEALRHLEGRLAIAQEIGDRRRHHRGLAELALYLASMGDQERARRLVEEAATMAADLPPEALEHSLPYLRGRVAELAGDATEAAARYRKCLEATADPSAQRDRRRARDGLARLAWSRDERVEALAHFRESYPPGTAHRRPNQEVVAAACFPEEAPTLWPDALPRLEAHPEEEAYVTCMEAHFRLWQSTGAAEHLERAREMLQALRERAPVAYRDSILSRVQLHREIRAGHRPG